MGPEFTLLRFEPAAEIAGLELAARDRGMPLRILDVVRPASGPYQEALVLSRPDQHIAWRGDQPPADLRRIFIRQLQIFGSTLGNPDEFLGLLE